MSALRPVPDRATSDTSWMREGHEEAEARRREEYAEIREAQWRHAAPARFRDARLDDLDRPVAEGIGEWRSAVDSDGCGPNLLLLGNVGTGKTHAAFAVARRAHDVGMSWRFWPVVELLDAMRPGGDGDAAFAQAAATPLLILDDVGGERPTDWTGERLYALVNRRWLERRPIVATSNLDASDGRGPLVDAVGERAYSRLVHGAVVLRVGGSDRRRS